MKAIKIRAWDKVNKHMWQAGQEGNEANDWIFVTYFDNAGKLRAEIYKTGMYPEDEMHYSLPIMQFTGLKDKNGIEVYEEDICQDGNGKIGVVKVFGGTRKMPNGYGGFEQFGLYEQCSDGWQHFKTTKFNGLEVLSNIYENPELLGGER